MTDLGQNDLIQQGTVWVFGDHVSVETISPLKYISGPEGRAANCLLDEDPNFAENVKPGDIVIAGRLFGHGPGHDHANLALKENRIGGIVARSFAPQFFRHSIDHGLLVAECDEILDLAPAGAELRVDFGTGEITNPSTGQTAIGRVPEGPATEVVLAGGLIPYIRSQLNA